MTDWVDVTVPTRAYARMIRRARPRAALIALHGYAENPERILEALGRPALAEVDILAPMGPHHFYNRNGQVVGSWMTGFRREDQIGQFLAMMDAFWARCLPADLPTYVFGFSQGAAAAYRLGVLSDRPVRRIFCLGGDMPPEVAAALAARSPRPIELFTGEEDDRVPVATMAADERRLREAGWPVGFHRFPGGHDYLPEALDAMGEMIARDVD